MKLVLSLPGLLSASATPAPAPAPAPALARLLAAAYAHAHESEGAEAALAARFGIVRQLDWPLAAIRLAALGVDPGDRYWLAADPVVLVAGRDDVRLTGVVTDLATADAAALIAALNVHFAPDGLVFVAPRPDAWFVAAASPPRIATRPLAVAIDRSLRALMPNGDDAPAWQRWQNEIQMLLHEHPVNVERERAGRVPVGGVWFSQGGTRQAATPGSLVRTWGTGGLAAALALNAGTPALPLPPNLSAVLSAANGADTLVVALDAPIDRRAVDAAWARPAWKALARRVLESVTVTADGAGNAASWVVPKPGPWQRISSRFATRDLDTVIAPARSGT
jgi:hypothetical protein